MSKILCLDGPLNGDYIDVEDAEAYGYTATPWTESHPEAVGLHTPTALSAFTTDGIPVEYEESEYDR